MDVEVHGLPECERDRSGRKALQKRGDICSAPSIILRSFAVDDQRAWVDVDVRSCLGKEAVRLGVGGLLTGFGEKNAFSVEGMERDGSAGSTQLSTRIHVPADAKLGTCDANDAVVTYTIKQRLGTEVRTLAGPIILVKQLSIVSALELQLVSWNENDEVCTQSVKSGADCVLFAYEVEHTRNDQKLAEDRCLEVVWRLLGGDEDDRVKKPVGFEITFILDGDIDREDNDDPNPLLLEPGDVETNCVSVPSGEVVHGHVVLRVLGDTPIVKPILVWK